MSRGKVRQDKKNNGTNRQLGNDRQQVNIHYLSLFTSWLLVSDWEVLFHYSRKHFSSSLKIIKIAIWSPVPLIYVSSRWRIIPGHTRPAKAEKARQFSKILQLIWWVSQLVGLCAFLSWNTEILWGKHYLTQGKFCPKFLVFLIALAKIFLVLIFVSHFQWN